MKRLLFLSSLAMTAIPLYAACDPDLTVPAAPLPVDGGKTPGPSPTAEPIPDGGPTADAEAGADAAVTAHEIDGTNDFSPGETFTTTSPAYSVHIAWDDKTVSFGMTGADIATGLASKWVLIYVDGSPGNAGTTAGIGYDCGGACTSQKALLPFSAGFHLRWKGDSTYTDLEKWNGSAWTTLGPITNVAQQGTFLELSIPRTALGNPNRLKVHMFMLIEKTGEEWTYAGAPAGSFTDGKSANASPTGATKYFDFDLNDRATAPNAFPLKP